MRWYVYMDHSMDDLLGMVQVHDLPGILQIFY